jgi:hypothetical protein
MKKKRIISNGVSQNNSDEGKVADETGEEEGLNTTGNYGMYKKSSMSTISKSKKKKKP